MMRNLRTSALTLAAVLMASAVAVSSAAAETSFHFTSHAGVNTLTGSSDPGTGEAFATHSGIVACLEAHYAGTMTGPTANSIMVTPSYTECHIIIWPFTFLVTSDPEGCQYRFNAVTKTVGKYEGSMDIVCPAGKQMKITAPGCTITVPSQNGLKTVTYTTVGSGTTRELTIDLDLHDMTYMEHGGSCATETVLTHNGVYGGKPTLTASQGNGHAHLATADT